MREEQILELAPLAALGALDGEERAAFDAAVVASMVGSAELVAFESVAARIGLSVDRRPPVGWLRERVLSETREIWTPHTRPATSSSWHRTALAATVVLTVGSGYWAFRAVRDANQARADLVAVSRDARSAHAETEVLQKSLDSDRALRELMARPDARLARLAGQAATPKATARVIWDPTNGEAILVAARLDPAPPGKAYEVWVIAGAAPVAAGVFQSSTDGSAVFRLPAVDETARVKTFAVTLEPAGGGPAPTGPMVLVGAAS